MNKAVWLTVVALMVQPAFATEETKSKEECTDKLVECIDPHACCKESEKVLQVLQELTQAYAKGDIKAYEEYLDDKCTVFDQGTKKVVHGKEAVLERLRSHFADFAPNGSRPMQSFTIDQPYAKVHGDTCVVTFVAHRRLGGAHPVDERAHITDVFVKRGDTWKKLHWTGQWVKEKRDKREVAKKSDD